MVLVGADHAADGITVGAGHDDRRVGGALVGGPSVRGSSHELKRLTGGAGVDYPKSSANRFSQ